VSTVPKWTKLIKAVWRTVSPIFQLPNGLDLVGDYPEHMSIVPIEDMPLLHYKEVWVASERYELTNSATGSVQRSVLIAGH